MKRWSLSYLAETGDGSRREERRPGEDRDGMEAEKLRYDADSEKFWLRDKCWIIAVNDTWEKMPKFS